MAEKRQQEPVRRTFVLPRETVLAAGGSSGLSSQVPLGVGATMFFSCFAQPSPSGLWFHGVYIQCMCLVWEYISSVLSLLFRD